VRLRVVQEPSKSGAVLMAEDSEYLQRAEAGEIGPILRFYEWDEPTVSLGYHQKPETLDEERLMAAGTPWVRRPTGGAAVLHSEELTYAIVVPGIRDSADGATIQESVGRAIAAGLKAVGVRAECVERGEPLAALSNRASCFVRTSRWEVTASGKKLVGSAQRRLANALLQHGSILVGDDHLRIVDFLAMSDETMRASLKERLRSKATCISAELGAVPVMINLRTALAGSFVATFAELSLGERKVRQDS
jgi:lipoyl(octanoyl) transferase